MSFNGISIIIPYYDDDGNIRRCLDAISQAIFQLSSEDRPLVEMIIIDDASPQPFSNQGSLAGLRCQRLEQNSGVGAARNAGARQAKFNYLMFIDSDVLLEENHLVIVFDTLRQKETKILQGAASSHPANENPSLFHHYMAISWHYIQSKYSWCFLATMCMVMERLFFSQMGGFPECYSDSGGEEFEFSARICAEDRNAIEYDSRLTFYHNYSGLIARLRKVLVRSSRLNPSVMPPTFKIEAGIRGVGAVLMSLALLLFPVNPKAACLAYLSLAILMFVADRELSNAFVKKHSWKLAIASVFYRQMEYTAVFCGLIIGFIKK